MIKNRTAQLVWQAFFLGIAAVGVFGVLRWCALLGIAFAALGYLFAAVDRVLAPRQKVKNDR